MLVCGECNMQESGWEGEVQGHGEGSAPDCKHGQSWIASCDC